MLTEFLALRMWQLTAVTATLLDLEDKQTLDNDPTESAAEVAERLARLLEADMMKLLHDAELAGITGEAHIALHEAAGAVKALERMADHLDDEGERNREMFFSMAYTTHRTMKAAEKVLERLAYGKAS